MSSFFGIIGCSFVCPSKDPEWNACIPATMKRRDPRIWHMAYAASHKVINQTQIQPNSIITGTALGALDETKNFLDTVYDTGFGNPRHFIASVHNSMAGKIALEFKITGPNITACDGQNSLASSLVLLESLNVSDFPVLLILVDEHIELLDRLEPQYSSLCKSFLKPDWEDGAVAFLLSKNTTDCKSTIRGFAPINRSGTPAATLSKIATQYVPDYKEPIIFESSSSSYLQPSISAYENLINQTEKRTLIGSYSPAADSVALVELNGTV